MNFWNNKCVAVTGGKGFLGYHLAKKLKSKKCKDLLLVDHKDYDLIDNSQVKKMYYDLKPDIVIHLAAVVGCIGANRKYPGKYFYENASMGINLIHEGYNNKIEKFVTIGTICAYPKFTKTPFKEEDIWEGYPEETNAPYGLAKKMLLVQCQAYRKQYGFNGIYLLPVNMYGPRDNFEPSSSHVIPAIIKKCLDGKNKGLKAITLWGSGEPTREFLFVEDAAEGILLATEKYNEPDPINIGVGFEIMIKDLADKIKALTGFKGEIIWDSNKPDGQPKRTLDIQKAKEKLSFEAKIDLDTGLKSTIDWYLNNN